MLHFWVNSFIKISVALMLLRIRSGKFWNIGLWTLIIGSVVVAFAISMALILSCRPASGYWTLSERLSGACWPSSIIEDMMYFWGGEFRKDDLILFINNKPAYNALTDLIVALLP
jgi:hypothetical protein